MTVGVTMSLYLRVDSPDWAGVSSVFCACHSPPLFWKRVVSFLSFCSVPLPAAGYMHLMIPAVAPDSRVVTPSLVTSALLLVPQPGEPLWGEVLSLFLAHGTLSTIGTPPLFLFCPLLPGIPYLQSSPFSCPSYLPLSSPVPCFLVCETIGCV